MATFAALAGEAKLVEKVKQGYREGQPDHLRQLRHSPVLFGIGKSAREELFYFTENG